MTLVILDPGLHMIAGHHFELDTALLEAAAALGTGDVALATGTLSPWRCTSDKLRVRRTLAVQFWPVMMN